MFLDPAVRAVFLAEEYYCNFKLSILLSVYETPFLSNTITPVSDEVILKSVP